MDYILLLGVGFGATPANDNLLTEDGSILLLEDNQLIALE